MSQTEAVGQAGPATDLRFAITRFIALVEAERHQPVVPSKGRRLAWKAVYGNLWTPDRVGEVPVDQRPALRAMVKQINTAVFPGGALAASVTADQAIAATRDLSTDA